MSEVFLEIVNHPFVGDEFVILGLVFIIDLFDD